MLISGAGGLRFKFQAGQIELILAMACHCCDIFVKEAVFPGRNDSEMGPHKLVIHFGIVQRAYRKI